MLDFNWNPSYPRNCTRELWSKMCRVFGRFGTSNRIGSQNQYICLYWSLAAIKGLLIWIFLNFLKTPGWQSRIKNRANAMSLTKMDTMKRLFLWVELALSDFLPISLKSDLYPFPQFVMKENDGDQERVKDKSEEKADEDWQVDICLRVLFHKVLPRKVALLVICKARVADARELFGWVCHLWRLVQVASTVHSPHITWKDQYANSLSTISCRAVSSQCGT